MTIQAVEPLATWKLVTQLVAVPLLLAYCLARRRNDLLILAACIVATTLYGLLQSLISARLAPEYFTHARPPIQGLSDPTLLGLAWGFLGGWWGGMLMGLAAGLTATLGRRPALTPRRVLPGVGCVLLGVAFVTLVSGGAAYYNGSVLGARVPGLEGASEERQLRFLAVACGHTGAYASAAAGGVALCVWVAWRRRGAAQVREG
jgi:hypothetical protein